MREILLIVFMVTWVLLQILTLHLFSTNSFFVYFKKISNLSKVVCLKNFFLFFIYFINMGFFYFFFHFLPKEGSSFEYNCFFIFLSLFLFMSTCFYIFIFSKDLLFIDSVKYFLLSSVWVWLGAISGYLVPFFCWIFTGVEGFNSFRIDFFLYETFCISIILFFYLLSKIWTGKNFYIGVNMFLSFIFFTLFSIFIVLVFINPFLGKAVKFINPQGKFKAFSLEFDSQESCLIYLFCILFLTYLACLILLAYIFVSCLFLFFNYIILLIENRFSIVIRGKRILFFIFLLGFVYFFILG